MAERFPEWWITRIDEGDVLRLAPARMGLSGPALVLAKIAGAFVWKDEDACSVQPSLSIATPTGAIDAARTAAYAKLSGYRPDLDLEPTWQRNPTGARDPFDAIGWTLEFHGATANGIFDIALLRRADGRFDRRAVYNLYDPAGGTPDTIEEGSVDEDAARQEVRVRIRWSEYRDPLPHLRPPPGSPRGKPPPS